ncbi:hypothetical protein acsn021_16440 [Anaerocolumna cellulosilytica]|uniref:Uncharacterized protein n=1 Tax=Anaerocolumna cellulosilytica TaxID=433286 RepID=A0A6S6R3J2_9FIRM|nr:hypothetical protein [Anaerocolumna cellulosilytica]MBB5197267.1 hypothetical protein [Anaerocolumna cellulosilytica]BCJ94075.1 hypothetical protein acsn021_16440 [Anaerocolumna cellulosilytica]
MKIALINGSPKIKDSNSGILLEEVKQVIGDRAEITYVPCNKSQLTKETIEELFTYDSFVIAFPLYVDGIPSHLLRVLQQLEEAITINSYKPVRIYGIANAGFYDAKQNRLALRILRNWSDKAGCVWGQGLGFGAGGMLGYLKKVPAGSGPKKNLGSVLQEFTTNILEQRQGENLYTTPNFSRFLYKLAAEHGWRQQVKSNGLKVRDLHSKR